jgi:hypothetical protein
MQEMLWTALSVSWVHTCFLLFLHSYLVINFFLDYAPGGLIVLSSEIYQALLSSRVSSSLVTHKFSIRSPMDELVASTYIAAPAVLFFLPFSFIFSASFFPSFS